MDGLPGTRRHSMPFRPPARAPRHSPAHSVFRAVAAAAALGMATSCSTGTDDGSAGTATTQATAAATATLTGPVTAEISQFRDNYGKHIIEIQLTNTTGAPLAVLGATVTSPLFTAAITWPADAGGIELPPGQTKSLPAGLPAPECASPAPSRSQPQTASGAEGSHAVVTVRLALPAGTTPDPAGATA